MRVEMTRELTKLLRELGDVERKLMKERASIEQSTNLLKEAITGKACLPEKANKQFLRR